MLSGQPSTHVINVPTAGDPAAQSAGNPARASDPYEIPTSVDQRSLLARVIGAITFVAGYGNQVPLPPHAQLVDISAARNPTQLVARFAGNTASVSNPNEVPTSIDQESWLARVIGAANSVAQYFQGR